MIGKLIVIISSRVGVVVKTPELEAPVSGQDAGSNPVVDRVVSQVLGYLGCFSWEKHCGCAGFF